MFSGSRHKFRAISWGKKITTSPGQDVALSTRSTWHLTLCILGFDPSSVSVGAVKGGDTTTCLLKEFHFQWAPPTPSTPPKQHRFRNGYFCCKYPTNLTFTCLRWICIACKNVLGPEFASESETADLMIAQFAILGFSPTYTANQTPTPQANYVHIYLQNCCRYQIASNPGIPS